MRAFVRMMPRIEAAEALTEINLAALSNGLGFESDLDRQRIIDGLERKASGRTQEAAPPADPADLAGMGIGMRDADSAVPVIGDLGAWLGNGEGNSDG